jgi:hypothetical protein
VAKISSDSAEIGSQLNQLLFGSGSQIEDVQTQLAGLRDAQSQTVKRAEALDAPGPLRDQQRSLVEALQLRVSGLNGLAHEFDRVTGTETGDEEGKLLAEQSDRLLASDVVYQDSFKAPSAAELDRQGVTGTNDSGGPLIPDSNFLQSSDLVTPTAMATVLSRIRGSASTPTTGGLRGTNLVSVKVQPAGTELSTSAQTTVVVRTNMSIDVTVEDSGDSQEANIPVTLRIIQSGVPTVLKRHTISFINPGEQKTVSFTNFPAPSFQNPAQIKVEVEPVQGESNTSNNSADYSVIFSVA